VGAYRVEKQAEEALSALREQGYEAYMVVEPDTKKRLWHKVRFGRYASLAAAKAQGEAFKARAKRDALVVLATRIPSPTREGG
jgi:cell division septation protein DedD